VTEPGLSKQEVPIQNASGKWRGRGVTVAHTQQAATFDKREPTENSVLAGRRYSEYKSTET
jgi:hypothetical protein